jgi:hypothetical protein
MPHIFFVFCWLSPAETRPWNTTMVDPMVGPPLALGLGILSQVCTGITYQCSAAHI